jgi:hypothetical protein
MSAVKQEGKIQQQEFRAGVVGGFILPIVGMMDLVNAAVNFKQAETISNVQYAVARKLLDNQKMQGAAALKLLDAASKISSGAGDELMAAATGLGGELDTYG